MSIATYTILTVDDSPIMLGRISEILQDNACITDIKKAASFDEALVMLASNQINVALLDINMRGKNGIQLLSFIKENYPTVKTIMLSNQSDDYYRNLCKKLGSDFFIDKTHEFDKITESVMRFYS